MSCSLQKEKRKIKRKRNKKEEGRKWRDVCVYAGGGGGKVAERMLSPKILHLTFSCCLFCTSIM